ncbi:MAG TPA: hypothetical protein VHD36_09475 [Pirellulales bacterium]|nr:hypothetical protein [Pirellulales bacterium]
MNCFELLKAAAAARSTEEAGFLFFAAQVRFEIDKQVFPPLKTGGDSPGTLQSALSMSVGTRVAPALKNDARAQAKAAQLLDKWKPYLGEDYEPGWEHKPRMGQPAATALVTRVHQKAIKVLTPNTKLLENAEYVRLTKERKNADLVIQRIDSQTLPGAPRTPEVAMEYEDAGNKRLAAALRMRQIEDELAPEMRWHAQAGWKAEDYFQDPAVIALCHAIEDNNIKEIERVIADGADVSAVGKDGMTPLLWAFPDRKLDRFACLLRHGANPNVYIESDFGLGQRAFHPHPIGGSTLLDRGCHGGQSVTHLASRSPVIEYLKLVLAHGGDADLIDKKTGEAPLDIVTQHGFLDMKDRVALLLTKKPELNRFCEYHLTYPAMAAVKSQQFGAALVLLKAGADPHLYEPNGERKLVHWVLFEKKRVLQYLPPDGAAEFDALVAWLAQQGETLDQAQADEDQWEVIYKKEGRMRGRQKIVTDRKAKEAATGKDRP